MPALVTLLLLAAFVCFTIPAVRAVLNRPASFDYTDSGLACLTLTFLLSGAL